MELCVFYLLIFSCVSLVQLLEEEVLGFSIQVSGGLGRNTACVCRARWLALLIYFLSGFGVGAGFGLSGNEKSGT